MMKWLAKKFMPSAESLAGYAADGLAKSVNESQADVKDKVARYAAFAAKATDIANRLAKMAEDGSISKKERDELRDMLTPLFEKVEALI